MKNIIWSTGQEIKFNDIINSDNCYLFDAKGNRLIDLESGVWCTSVGHNNKRINEVIASQINKIIHTGFCYCHPQINDTAGKILEITRLQGGKCEFLCSGSEAVEYGMRVARKVSSRPLALTFSDSYFGAYGDAVEKNKNNWYVYDWLNCSCSRDGSGCMGECEDFLNIPFHQIGIFLFEPGSSSGLVRFPSPELIDHIQNRVRNNSGLIMANEITTGLGRTGEWFGFQHYKISPDIVAIGKGLGNGYPVSATAISGEIASHLKIIGFHYSQSHQNDPLGAIVANEVINIIEDENLLERCAETGQYLKKELVKLKTKYHVIKEVRGRGLMIAIELYHSASLIYEELLRKGYIVAKRPNQEVLRIDPALTVEKETIVLFLESICEILEGY